MILWIDGTRNRIERHTARLGAWLTLECYRGGPGERWRVELRGMPGFVPAGVIESCDAEVARARALAFATPWVQHVAESVSSLAAEVAQDVENAKLGEIV